MNAAGLLRLLSGLSPTFASEGPAEAVWYDCSDLVGDRSRWRGLVEDHAAARGTDFNRYAASLFFQRYSHRIAGLTAACWAAADAAPVVVPADCRIAVASASPVALDLAQTRWSGSADEVMGALLDEHLLPLGTWCTELTRNSPGNMRGNIAAAMALGARQASRIRPADEVMARVQALLAERPWLERLGDYRIVTGPLGARLTYERRSCCLWYAIPDGKYCTWCSKLEPAERRTRIQRSVDQEQPTALPDLADNARTAPFPGKAVPE